MRASPAPDGPGPAVHSGPFRLHAGHLSALAAPLSGLDRSAARLARLEGRREAHLARRAELARDVGLAKARLARRGEVEALLERLQAEASRRNVASFETLLTALVQEVLPGEKPVVLELATERGAPALDIGVRRADGTREDVLEDNGGALTNVIGMALRLIAVVKAGVGRFLALDEADCWIAPDRVPAFYRVLEDGAARLGVQCLAISHHDMDGFDARIRVSRIAGHPETGVSVVCPRAEPWDEAQPGFRFIRLVDVQGYADATLFLSPGINALTGPNNRGKSTFIRALRAVFYAEARDSLVRAGAASATVELGVAHGRTLRFTRQPRRSPVNLWSLHEADGRVVEENGTRHETGGRAAPDWVAALFGIVKVEDLDVHVAHQKFPVFLLGEPPSRRSAVLSIGQEAGYIRDMLAIHKERCTADLALVRQGERELAGLAESLKRFDDLPALAERLAGARGEGKVLESEVEGLGALDAVQARLAAARTRLDRLGARARALQALPPPDRPAALSLDLAGAAERERIGAAVGILAGALRRARRRRAALAALPPALPALAATTDLEGAAERLQRLQADLARARGRAELAAAAMAEVQAKLAALVRDTGGLCPACGHAVDPADLLGPHSHAQVAA
ncbi:MAG TPA: AAA family ATPase [Microvirga sp.]|jgi:chorismate mutase|nr:AAA family ATPase [Microvirga sp.]